MFTTGRILHRYELPDGRPEMVMAVSGMMEGTEEVVLVPLDGPPDVRVETACRVFAAIVEQVKASGVRVVGKIPNRGGGYFEPGDLEFIWEYPIGEENV